MCDSSIGAEDIESFVDEGGIERWREIQMVVRVIFLRTSMLYITWRASESERDK